MDSISSNPSTKSKVIYGDRFIPNRIGSNFSLFNLPSFDYEGSTLYAAVLRSALFAPPADVLDSFGDRLDLSSSTRSKNIFRYKSEFRRLSSSFVEVEDYSSGVVDRLLNRPRKIICSPYKVLDAPGLQDDYHLNLLDWSSNNVVAVGLESRVFLWNACSAKVTLLCDLDDFGVVDSVCSLGWSQCGTHLAVGTESGKVQIWDASKCRRIRSMKGHRLRVGALAWCSSMLSSGSRDKCILHHDIRALEDYVVKLKGHKSEVCGMKWSYDNRELASGGSDDRLFIWNQHSTRPVLKFCEHTAAIKAIAWSPHRHGLLASGGGSADRCIRLWNTTTNTHLSCMDTGSQVCNLAWLKNVNELVSTHGDPQNNIIVWRYPTKSKIATLSGHMSRVLYMAVSPDGQTIVTGAADEKLKFWNIFPPLKSKSTRSDFETSSFSITQIR